MRIEKTWKRVLSLIIALVMVVGLMPPASASAVTMTGGEKLYLKPNSNWKEANARFAIYVFNSSGNAWASMEGPNRDGIYEATVPSGNWTNVIFVRMDSSSTNNTWDTDWNQTSDLEYNGTDNLYTVAEGAWSNGSGTWSTYEAPAAMTVTIHFQNTEGWASVNGYAWNTNNGAKLYTDGWPGTATVKNANGGWHTMTLTNVRSTNLGVIFNNGSGSQTRDIFITNAVDGGEYWCTSGGLSPEPDGWNVFDIKVEAENGTVTVPATAKQGENVTLTVAPVGGFELTSLTVKQGNTVQNLTDNQDGTYTFTMPGGDVTVSATFVACDHATTKAEPNGNGTHNIICTNSTCNGYVVTANVPCDYGTGSTCACGAKCGHSSFTDSVCDACGYVCDHSGNTAQPTDNGSGKHSFTCSVCHGTVTEPHTFDSATGKCACGVQAQASVTPNGGEAVYYTVFSEALSAWLSANDQTLTLWTDVTADSTIKVAKAGLVLDLNGKTLTGNVAVGVYEGMGSYTKGELTLKDSDGNGKISGKLSVDYGSAEMTGGWIDNSNIDNGVYVGSGTTFTISGGKVTGWHAIVNLGTVHISGNVTLEGKDYNEDNPGYGLLNTGTVIVSGNPTIQGETIDISTDKPITFRYVPTPPLRVKMHQAGLFAVADGVTLTEDMFVSKKDGLLVAQMEGGIGLVACDHQGVEVDCQYLNQYSHRNTYSCCGLTETVAHTMENGVCTACGGRYIHLDVEEFYTQVFLFYGENGYESMTKLTGIDDGYIWRVIAPPDADTVYFSLYYDDSSVKTVSTEIPADKNCFRVTDYDSETGKYNGVWYSYPCTSHTFTDDGYCTVCGAACDHARVTEDGKCEDCGLQHAVQVTAGAVTAYCVDFDETVTYIRNLAGSDTVYITLLDSTSGYYSTMPARTVVLDLNGKTLNIQNLRYDSGADVTLKGSTGSKLIVGSHYVKNGAKLILESGTILSEADSSPTVYVYGTFVMNGGEVSTTGNNADAINVQDSESVVQIKGGTVSSKSGFALINVNPSAKIELSGGTFIGGIRNYSNEYEPVYKYLQEMMAEDCKLVDADGNDVNMNSTEVTGTVSVICDHSKSNHETATDLGNGKHSFICSVCHGTGTEDCTFGDTDTCICGAKAKAKVVSGETNTYYATLEKALAAGGNVYPLAGYAGDFTIPRRTSFYGEGYTFAGAVTNLGNIQSGTFTGDVTHSGNGIEGGTFKGTVTAIAIIEGGIFEGTVTTNTTINGGTFHSTVLLLDDEASSIRSGTFNGTVTNNGTITGGTFNDAVTNNGTINNSSDPTTFTLGDAFDLTGEGEVYCTSHIWKDGACRLCGHVCDHSTSEHTTCADKGDGTHSFICSVCSSTDSENHTFNPTTGNCGGCGILMAVAKTETGGTTTYFPTLQGAIDEAEALSGSTVTVLDDVTLTQGLTVDSGTFTLDLNGKTVSAAADTLIVKEGGNITIKTSVAGGTLSMTGNKDYALRINRGTVTLENGTVSSECLGICVDGGSFTMKSGEVTSKKTGIITVSNATAVILSGKVRSEESTGVNNNGGNVTLGDASGGPTIEAPNGTGVRVNSPVHLYNAHITAKKYGIDLVSTSAVLNLYGIAAIESGTADMCMSYGTTYIREDLGNAEYSVTSNKAGTIALAVNSVAANTAWFVSADAGYEVTADGYELKLSLIEYTVTYNLDGGSLAQDESNPRIYYVNTDTFTLHNPTRVGYLFTGWTGTELDAATMEVTITKGSTGNRGYTATWQECTHPNVTYDDNGNGTHSADCSVCGTTVTNDHDYGTTHRCECGKGEAFAVSLANDIYYVTVDYSQTATFGTDYTATITPDQYFYIGDDHWVTIGGKDYTGYTLAEGVLTIPGADITGEIVIYARGYLIPAKVTWDYNGGTVVVEHEGEVWIKTQSGANTYLGRTTDTAFCVELGKLTRPGYLFTGWNTVKEPTEVNPGVAYAKDADIFVDKENIVLYAQWTKIDLSAENGTYNGQAHKPAVTIEGMTEGTDFQVTYPADMTSVGEKTITVTDLDEYGSTTTVTYTVEARDISDAVVTMDDDLTYNGKTQNAKITKVQLGDMILTEGTDYTLSGNTAADSGEYELTVTGTGNFTGSVKAEWKIAKRLAAITAKDQTITYGGDISGTEYTADGLVDGHSVSVTLNPNTDKVTVNGSIAVSGAKITAGDVDVTANYDITYASGKLVIEPDASGIKDLTAENVTSADEEAVKAVQDMLDNAESTKEEWADISEKCEQLLDRIDEVNKQNEAIAEDVASFDEESVNSDDKAALEELAEEMEALLESENLTQEEREALGVDLEQVEDMIAVIEQIAADSKAATDQVEALDSETVTSDDQTQLEQAVANIEELLETDHLTEEERKALAEVKASAETMLETVEAAHKAVDTESINNSMEITAENVSREDKEILAKAKSDLEKALHNHGGNYTEEEKQIIRTELVRIQKALKVIENAEDVEAAIDALPETVVPDDGEMAIKILNVKAEYDALTEHEKSLVTEAAVKKLNGLLAALTDYRLIMGGGGIFTKESKEGLYFKANGHFDKFTGILVDGKAVDKANYEAKSGSTIVILKPAYLDTLAEGEHTLTFLYTDGEVSGTFLVKAKATVPPTEDGSETTPPTTKEEPSTTPPTGDGFQPMLWIAVMSISLGLMVLLEERRRNIRK